MSALFFVCARFSLTAIPALFPADIGRSTIGNLLSSKMAKSDTITPS